MADNAARLYEGMFLISQSVAGELDQAIELVRGLLGRSEADVLALRRWDERKLAYPIVGQKRGTYLIAYFKMQPSRLASLERDCNLSDEVLRVMVTKTEHFGELELKQALEGVSEASPARTGEREDEPAFEEDAVSAV